MSGMFAHTEALTINFLDSWNIPDDCDTNEMKEGSGLENVNLKSTKINFNALQLRYI